MGEPRGLWAVDGMKNLGSRDETVSKLTSGSITSEYFHPQAQVHSLYSIVTSQDLTHWKEVIALFTTAVINKGQVWVLRQQ